MDDATYKWRAFGAVGLFFVTAVLAFIMVFLALPAIAEDFGITLRSASWIVIVYALTISSLLLPMGRLADLIGRRRIHLLGLLVFGAGALLVALSPTFEALIAARVVMAVGDAMAQSVGTGILVSVFPKHERGKAIASQTTSVAVGAALAPIFTGLILAVLPWRALFLLLIVPVVIAFVAGVVFLDEERLMDSKRERQPFDRVGAALSSSAIVLLVVIINNPFGLSWASVLTLGLVFVAVALLVAFIGWELATEAPMMDLRFFTNPVFTVAVAARFVGFAASATVYVLLPIFLISLRGMSEARAGVIFFLNSVGLGVAAQVSGRLSDRFGTRPFMLFGFVAAAVTSSLFAMMNDRSSLWLIAATSLVYGLANGSWSVPNNATIIGSVSPISYGVIGAFTNLTRNVGGVVGQASVAAVVTWVMLDQGFDIPLDEIGDTVESSAAFISGWSAAFGAATVLFLVASMLAFVIRPSKEST